MRAPGKGRLRRRWEARIHRWWRGEAGVAGRALSLLLAPAGGLYRAGTALRNMAFDREILSIRGVSPPVISVGNLVVGGTGKTPVTAWLARELADAGARPAVVSRGYGGDEVALHRRWNPDVPVHADPDRVAAARAAEGGGATVVLADDAFQHRRLRRELDLVLVAAEHPLDGPVLPRGPHRERVDALARADAVLVTRKIATDDATAARVEALRSRWPHLAVGRVDLVADRWTDLEGRPADRPARDVLAVTGVADPRAFAGLVERETGQEPELVAFPDHHPFDDADAERILRAAGPRTVVTTEKDAVKLGALRTRLPDVRVLTLAVRPGPGAEDVLARVRRVAGVAAVRGREE